MNEPMLKVSDLTHRVSLETDTLTILQGVSLEINRGESVAIVGRSGSGKTTLLGLLAGLETPTEGTVELDGAVISKLSEDERARLRAQRVGFVFQPIVAGTDSAGERHAPAGTRWACRKKKHGLERVCA